MGAHVGLLGVMANINGDGLVTAHELAHAYCNTLQHTATHKVTESEVRELFSKRVLERVRGAAWSRGRHQRRRTRHSARLCSRIWQHTATHCNTLQHTATHKVTESEVRDLLGEHEGLLGVMADTNGDGLVTAHELAHTIVPVLFGATVCATSYRELLVRALRAEVR